MPHDDASLSTANPDLTVAERRVLDRIFQHPLSHNLSWREVISFFAAKGEVKHAHNGHLVLKVGTGHLTFETGQAKDLAADEVLALRHLLSRAGWKPGAAAAKPGALAGSAIAIVIDHAGARIYDLPLDEARHAPHETHHLHHAIDRKEHDADRAETFPADHRFFDAIAKDLPGDARIVVVSHGKGQSNEGQHLLDYMHKHHRGVHDRIARVIAADVTHTTVPEELRLARDALLSAPDSADAIAS
jgi:hypothetical protein